MLSYTEQNSSYPEEEELKGVKVVTQTFSTCPLPEPPTHTPAAHADLVLLMNILQ